MKFLLDMNLPPVLATRMQEAGIGAIHWSTVGDGRASDSTVLRWAAANDHVLITHDLDMGALLAAGDLTKPSVLQLRTRDLHPSKYLPLLLAAIEQSADALLAGALVCVHEADARIRILPLRAPKP